VQHLFVASVCCLATTIASTGPNMNRPFLHPRRLIPWHLGVSFRLFNLLLSETSHSLGLHRAAQSGFTPIWLCSTCMVHPTNWPGMDHADRTDRILVHGSDSTCRTTQASIRNGRIHCRSCRDNTHGALEPWDLDLATCQNQDRYQHEMSMLINLFQKAPDKVYYS
jgi:hypothetical protein